MKVTFTMVNMTYLPCDIIKKKNEITKKKILNRRKNFEIILFIS